MIFNIRKSSHIFIQPYFDLIEEDYWNIQINVFFSF